MRLIQFLSTLIAMTAMMKPTMEAQANEIQFVEDFVLAKDRTEAIEQLIPGTDVYYFYQCIHLQNDQKYDEVDKLLTQWQQRHGESQALREIRHRQMLLTYSTSPRKSLDYLINELRPNLDHQRDQLESKPELPIKLDQAKISYDALKKAALRRHKGLKGFEDQALLELGEADLDPLRRRELLSRLKRPAHRDLIDLILADLNYKGSRGFGSLEIHRQLLLSQLDELISRRPAIENETQFVNIYLQKLQPSPDADWRNDAEEMEAFLRRLWDFVGRLNASHNSLKAHVLYHWLLLDETRGTYSKRRFLTYLALPRHLHYIAPRLLENAEARRYPVDLAMNPGGVTQLPPILNDEPLVRRYFLHFFQTENNYTNYVTYVKDEYLRHLFAEAKITNGLGDPEKWYALLPPAKYQELKDRVDLDFAPTNPSVFRADDPVQLDVYVKHVDKLIVKVYEVNTRNYYQQYSREVNTDIELDGLVANHETTLRYDDAPVIRKRRHFEFPELQAPGVYVIDFIGNGKSSRAVVRKGQLHYISEINAAGHVFHVFNDKLEQLKDVSLWMSGQQFDAASDGSILVPFSTKPGGQPIVLTHGNLSSLHTFQHVAENYQFNVAAHIDREALLERQEAVVLLRPELRLSGIPVSTQVLENVRVTLQSTDLDGVNSEKTHSDVQLFEDKETPLVFLVPNRLASIQVNVTAVVTDARQDKRTLSASHQVTINQIDESDKIEDLHLTKVGGAYVLELLGKSGEPRAHRHVKLRLRHKQFTDIVNDDLATDEHGLVQLGALDRITRITAKGPTTPEKSWTLHDDRRTSTSSVHARRGELIRVPHMKGPKGLRTDQVTLYELRGGSYAKEVARSVKITDHFVELKGLAAGDYSLDIDSRQLRIRVVEGRDEAGYVLGGLRRIERRRLQPIQLTSISTDDTRLEVQLENASKFSRVHVYATRFVPAFDVYQALSRVREVEPLTMVSPAQRSYYMAGRKLGDELQYVLERAYATKYPGNMLERPTLLLNSWPMRGTETSTQTAAAGEDFDAAAPAPSAETDARAKSDSRREAGLVDFANLDFLSEPSVLVANRQPDDQGIVSIELEELGPHQHIHVVAVDPLSTVYRSIALPKVTVAMRDLRLKKGLDAEKHYTQQKTVTQLRKDEQFELADITTGRFETYDSLASIYSLYSTLSGNEVLKQFRFVLDWPKLSTDEKRDKYSEFACHELNFFLYKKDPAFFGDVVRPYIENKHHKTFLDLWLLDADLTDFLEPWRYRQLNTTERLLLGERSDGEDVRVTRLVEDLFGLIPRDVGRQNFLFETAVQGKALDFGLGGASALAREKKLAALADMEEAESLHERGAFSYDAADAGVALQESLQFEAEPADRKRSLARRGRARAESRRQMLSDALDDKNAAAAGRYFSKRGLDLARRQLYEKLEKTREWAENNYYRLPIQEQDEDLILVNAFWHDYARRKKNEPFFSIHWPTATRNFSEMMFALSLLDLPMEPSEHKTEFEQQQMTLTAAGPMVVFQEQIREAESQGEASPILITQNLFRADDRYQMVQGVRRDKFVTDEFLVHVVYGCQVVLTNPTSTQRKVQLLVQIPHASIATNGGKATKTLDFDLAPYHTETVDYFFYFPAAGEYPHFPAHVSQDETLLAHATPATLKVVETPSSVDKQSWEYISQFGSDGEVLNFLRENNVFELDLARIAFRMKDRAFFDKAISLLQDRHAYSAVLWAYGLKHNDRETIATYLKHNDRFLASCGETLDSELIRIDPVVRRTYQHLDYKPLVNARAHRLGGRRQILNNRFHEQYHQLLEVLKYRRELDNEDRIAMTYYLLLQDRIEESMNVFSTVERSNLDSQIQYDYFAAYLDCFRDEPSQARTIVTRYVNHPVPKWQNAFASVKGILDELDGHEVLVVDPKDRTQTQTAAAAEQTNFTFTVEDRKVRVDYQNVEQLQVNYYLIDLELLFSSSPFVQKFSGQFSHIKPHDAELVSLQAGQEQHEFELPNELHNRNILVEIVAAGITRSQAYFSNSLTVQVSENYGHLRVTETTSGRPLPKTYVKVYSEMNDGRTVFYKDGYTDLRGRFDYSSLSTNELDFVKRFSILVLDDERGGLVREARAPKQ